MKPQTKQNIINLAIMVSLPLAWACGKLVEKVHPSMATMKADAELEAELLLPKMLPDGWKVFDQPKCVSWCREMTGSEFFAEVIDNDYRFVKIRMTCDGDKGSKQPCSWEKVGE